MALVCILSPTPLVQTKISQNPEEALLAHLLKKYHLDRPAGLFRYTHDTEVRTSFLDESFALSPHIEEIARTQHRQLNSSRCFDISFITQPASVRSYQLKKKFFRPDMGTVLTFTTDDNVVIKTTYFDRGSDTLVVVGPGFTNEREKMAPFMHIFAEYDVVFFDYRGHGYEKKSWFNPISWNFNPFVRFFGAHPRKARLGLDEGKDVAAVIRGMKARKPYKKVAGLGLCYSALIFVKADIQRPMELIFNGPMSPHRLGKLFDISFQT